MPRLTKRMVESTVPGTEKFFLWCDELPSFGVRIYPSGAKVYQLQWKHDRRTRRLVLGRHGLITCK